MEKMELWHVFVDDKTRMRSCYYGFLDALTFNQEGEFKAVCQGKTEIPFDKWTEEELCWMMVGCLKESKMCWLSNIPKIIPRALGKCGVEKEKTDLI